MGGGTSGQALKSPGRSTRGPLLPVAARCLTVTTVAVCVLVIAIQGVWIRYGMETSWLDAAVDGKIAAGLGGHPLLLAMMVWPGDQPAIAGITAVLILVCLLWRRYQGAALLAISIPAAAMITERLLKPLVGGTSWGYPFPSGHVTGIVALATALTVLIARVTRPLRLALAFTAFLIAGSVALGVIGAQMHHLSDAIGGAAVGVGTVLATALILDLLFNTRRR